MTEAVTVYDQGQGQVVRFDQSRLDLLKRTIAPSTTNDQFDLFVEVCRRTGLDPFAKQIYPVVRMVSVKVGDRWEKEPVMTIQTGIDGYRLITQRAGNYAGMDGPYWCGKDGEWRDVWLDEEPPMAAKVGVRATGDSDWTTHVSTYREYVQTVAVYENKQETTRKPNSMWASMPANQLAKCAEAGARRKRWASDLAHVYVDAEARATEYIDAANTERQLDARPPQAAIQQPARKSAPKAATSSRKQSEPPFGSEPPAADTETGEVIEGELVPAHRNDAPPANFGEFWNALPDLLAEMGKSLGDVGMNLNCEPSPAGLRKWYDMNDTDPIGAVRAALGVK